MWGPILCLQTGVGIESHSFSVLEPSFSLLSSPAQSRSPGSPQRHWCHARENGVHTTASRKRREHQVDKRGVLWFPRADLSAGILPGTDATQEREDPPGRMAPTRGTVEAGARVEARLGRVWRGGKPTPDTPLQGCPPAPLLPPPPPETQQDPEHQFFCLPGPSHPDPRGTCASFFKRFLNLPWRLLYQGEPQGGDYSSSDRRRCQFREQRRWPRLTLPLGLSGVCRAGETVLVYFCSGGPSCTWGSAGVCE